MEARVDRQLGENGWHTGDVVVAWTISDPESAVTSTQGCDPVTLTAEAAGTTLTCTATSAGGTASESVTIKIDKMPPPVACSAAPATLWPQNHKLVAVTADLHVSDALLGLSGFVLDSVTSSEADAGLGFDDRPNDVPAFLLGTQTSPGCCAQSAYVACEIAACDTGIRLAARDAVQTEAGGPEHRVCHPNCRPDRDELVVRWPQPGRRGGAADGRRSLIDLDRDRRARCAAAA
ncbi:MAG: hypothetical protein ABR583_14780 [Gaiellaceae bacterium]